MFVVLVILCVHDCVSCIVSGFIVLYVCYQYGPGAYLCPHSVAWPPSAVGARPSIEIKRLHASCIVITELNWPIHDCLYMPVHFLKLFTRNIFATIPQSFIQ